VVLIAPQSDDGRVSGFNLDQPRCNPDPPPIQSRCRSGLHRGCIGVVSGLVRIASEPPSPQFCRSPPSTGCRMNWQGLGILPSFALLGEQLRELVRKLGGERVIRPALPVRNTMQRPTPEDRDRENPIPPERTMWNSLCRLSRCQRSHVALDLPLRVITGQPEVIIRLQTGPHLC
jgi:hypothetical protein